MDLKIDELLRRLESDGPAHDAAEPEHRRRLLNLERPTAELLHLLIASGRRGRVLDIGTSNGYSAIWIAMALRKVPGASPLITIERDPAKAEQARENFERVGLSDLVTVLVGDATDIVRQLEGPFDAVFFDADRVSAPEQLALLLPRLEPDVLLLADNVLSHPQEMAGYLAAVAALPGFASTLVPVGKGLHVAHRAAMTD